MVRGVDLTDLGLLPTFFILVLSRSFAILSYLGVLWPTDRGVFLPSLRVVPEDKSKYCYSISKLQDSE